MKSKHIATIFTRQYVNHFTQKNQAFIKFCSAANSVTKDIEKIVKSSKVVLFMKGTPDEPSCGFSNAVVQILKMHGVNDYKSVDVLEDENIRSSVKLYSKWSTIPQVFFDGDFVGGCDIMLELHKSGGLVDELKKVGIQSALKDV